MGAHLGMCKFIPSLSYTPENIRCDSRASLLVHTFASPCLVHERKAKFATLGSILNYWIQDFVHTLNVKLWV